MRQVYFYLALALFILMIFSCSKTLDEVNPKDNKGLNDETTLNKDEQLQGLISYIENVYGVNKGVSHRTSSNISTDFGEIKTDSVIRKFDSSRNRVVYTALIEREKQFYGFENLVMIQIENGFKAFIIQYIPDFSYNKAIGSKDFLLKFNGTVRQLNLEGNLVAEYKFQDGKGQGQKAAGNARTTSTCLLEAYIYIRRSQIQT